MKVFNKIGLIGLKLAANLIPTNHKQVLFYSKPDFSDNGRALYEEFVRQALDKEYSVVWLVNGNCSELSKKYPGIRFFSHRSAKGFIEFAKSKYIFKSHTLYGNVRSKKQVVTLVWHGMGIKGPMDYFKYEPDFADYLTVSSDIYRYRLAARFKMTPSHCITTGLPRNDYLFQGKYRKCLDALPKVAEHPGCRTILWMPTFHTNKNSGDKAGKYYELGIPVVTEQDIPRLNNHLCEKNIVLLIKLHPHVIGEGSINNMDYSNIQVFSDKDLPADCSLYHLLGGVDAMFTDYSSVFTDFMLLDRPIAFVYDDFEEYKKKPGFAFERVDLMMPGVHIRNIEDMYQFISDFAEGIDKGAEERRILNRFINFYCDGKNSLRVLESIGLIKN